VLREKGSHPRFGVFRRRLVVFVRWPSVQIPGSSRAPRRAPRTISGKRDWRRLTYGLTTRMSPSPIGCSSPSRPVQPLQGLRTLELEPWPVLRNKEVLALCDPGGCNPVLGGAVAFCALPPVVKSLIDRLSSPGAPGALAFRLVSASAGCPAQYPLRLVQWPASRVPACGLVHERQSLPGQLHGSG